MTTVGLSRRRLILATAGTMLALLLAALDQTIVGTAIPRIVADLNGLDRLAWVTTAYLVTSTTMTPIAGKLGDLFGRKPFLLVGMIGFVASSALCGLSQDMTQLIVFRGVQGLFGGVLFATVFSVIGDLFPPTQRARAQGLFGAVFGLSSIIGPTAGGFITDHWSWRWVFEVNIPVGIIAVAVVTAGFVDPAPDDAPHQLGGEAPAEKKPALFGPFLRRGRRLGKFPAPDRQCAGFLACARAGDRVIGKFRRHPFIAEFRGDARDAEAKRPAVRQRFGEARVGLQSGFGQVVEERVEFGGRFRQRFEFFSQFGAAHFAPRQQCQGAGAKRTHQAAALPARPGAAA